MRDHPPRICWSRGGVGPNHSEPFRCCCARSLEQARIESLMNPSETGEERLRLGDLMAVIACLAAAMGAFLPLRPFYPDPTWNPVEVVLFTVLSLVWGMLLAGPVLHGLRRVRNPGAAVSAVGSLWIVNAVYLWIALVCLHLFHADPGVAQHPLVGWLIRVWFLGWIVLQAATLYIVGALRSDRRNREPETRPTSLLHRLGLLVCTVLLAIEISFVALAVLSFIVYMLTRH